MPIPLIIASAVMATAQTPLFTPEERDGVMQYWAESDRYRITPPQDFAQKGLWRVRQTVGGSVWLYNLTRARGAKLDPNIDVVAKSEQGKIWDAWVDARVAYDRWQSGQAAVESNRMVLPAGFDLKDPSVPMVEPPQPGPIPPDLLSIAGDPPRFAEAAIPMAYTIKFDDGSAIGYTDNVSLRPKYAYYRFERGVRSSGTPLPKGALGKLFRKAGVSGSEARVMQAVSSLEGGFDSINTYDTGFVSVGFIQFAAQRDGNGSLGKVLLDYKTDEAEGFGKDFRRFGIDVDPSGVVDVVDPATGAELRAAEAIRKIIDDKRLTATFQRAGQKSEPFNAEQIRAARDLYYPAEDSVDIGVAGISVVGKVSEFIHSEAGMATLMDRKVNVGKLDALIPVLQKLALDRHITRFAEFAKYEREIVAAVKYRKDFLADRTLSQPK